jgi:hypothetical protein
MGGVSGSAKRAAVSSPFRASIPPQVPLAEDRGTCGGICGMGGAAHAAVVETVEDAAGFTAQAAAQAVCQRRLLAHRLKAAFTHLPRERGAASAARPSPPFCRAASAGRAAPRVGVGDKPCGEGVGAPAPS